MANESITGTVKIYTTDWTLVDTATYSDLQYTISNLTAGTYYIEAKSTGYGTVVKEIEIIDGTSDAIQYLTFEMVTGIDTVEVTLVDKDDVVINDANITIAGIPATFDTDHYELESVPIGDQLLTIDHDTATYQSISRSVTIQSGISFPNEVLYPIVNAYIKVYAKTDENDTFDLTNYANAILYNYTNSVANDTTVIPKSGGYFRLNSCNNGTYVLYIPSFTVVINGINYTVTELKESVYIDYNSSNDGELFFDLNTTITN